MLGYIESSIAQTHELLAIGFDINVLTFIRTFISNYMTKSSSIWSLEFSIDFPSLTNALTNEAINGIEG